MNRNYDASIELMKEIASECEKYIINNDLLSESDTRIKIIDRILHEVLYWNESNISREDCTNNPERKGFTDYQLKISSKPIIVVEAKNTGVYFSLPSKPRTKIKIKSILAAKNDLSKAVSQCREYCDDCNIRYGIVTNGVTWIIFRGLREDIPWKEGDAIVFYNFAEIINNFTQFWNLISFENIASGFIDNEFTTVVLKQKSQRRIIDRLYLADQKLERNRLQSKISVLIEEFFGDIADKSYIEILKECYIHNISADDISGFKATIKDEIPRFLKNANTKDVFTTHDKSGKFSDEMVSSIEGRISKILLVLGGIGSGKTTFLKRYFRLTDAKYINDKSIWFYISFLGPPSSPKDIPVFIYQHILNELREQHTDIISENRVTIKKAFADQIRVINESIIEPEGLTGELAERRLSPFIEKWQSDIVGYTARLIKLLPKRGRAVIICLDNVDQLKPEYQEEIYLAAHNINRETGSIIILSLREETFYTSRSQKIFTAYINQKFHIASPDFIKLIGKRIKYTKDSLEKPFKEIHDKYGIEKDDKDDIKDFFSIIEDSMFNNNKSIVRFISSLCFGDMRLALKYFSIFLISGATSVDKMLGIYRRDGGYTIAFHEFVKSIMVGDRKYYKESESDIINLFSYGSEKNSSHFTCIRILNYLKKRQSLRSVEGPGFVEISSMMLLFDEVFDNVSDFVSTSNRLLEKKLIETNTKLLDDIQLSSHIRITSAGLYYLFNLCNRFVYLDLILHDTPIDDDEYYEALFAKTLEVERYPEYEKRAKTVSRLERAQTFVDYLVKQEELEINNNQRMKEFDDFSFKITDSINEKFRSDRDWILHQFKQITLVDVEQELLKEEDVEQSLQPDSGGQAPFAG